MALSYLDSEHSGSYQDFTTGNLEEFHISTVPKKLYYIPNFITKDEEEQLLSSVYKAPKPKWTVLSNRRLQNWGGLPHPKGMIVEPLPEYLSECTAKVEALNIMNNNKPNHVLVNEYLPGQGILSHTDGPLYHPVVCTISLGSSTLLDFYRRRGEDQSDACSGDAKQRFVASILLQPRSLIVVSEDMYTHHEHEIAQRTEDIISADVANLDRCSGVTVGDALLRGTRVSLTIRYVPKTLKTKLWLR